MIELKRTVKEAKLESKGIDIESERYPYGLRINLQKEEIDKLKIDLAKFDVGQKVELSCRAEVTEIRGSVGLKKKPSGLGMQITHMEIKPGKKSKFAAYEYEQRKGPGE